MRILHTSDWHLGVSHEHVRRGADHDLFFDWLLETLDAQEVDALVIAGDIFDRQQPSAEALGRYYRFLRRVAEETGTAQVLVVGGNHDSAARLEAAAPVLEALQVSVVGGVSGLEDALARCVVPLKSRDAAIGAVALAVPYVAEFHLGVRTTDADTGALSAQFRERFGALYSRLADQAEAAFPGVPIVATGHLNLGSQHLDEAPEKIHRVGHIEALPVSVIDPRVQYGALGHIHRCYPVDEDRRVWFSGSPIALSVKEARVPRRALLVSLREGGRQIDKLAVPATRDWRVIESAPEELPERLRALTWDEPLPPLLQVRVVCESMPPELRGQVHEALASFAAEDRPEVIELRPVLQAGALVEDEALGQPLAELGPEAVFARLCQARGIDDADQLAALDGALARLISHKGEAAALCESIVGREATSPEVAGQGGAR